MDLERILTKDISPESFKDSSVDSTRHYFGPTRKIYVYSGYSGRISWEWKKEVGNSRECPIPWEFPGIGYKCILINSNISQV